MAIAYSVEKFVFPHEIPFNVLKHSSRVTSLKCAEATHTQGKHLTKAVLLADDEGDIVAVLFATHRIELGKLLSQTGRAQCRKSGRDQKIAAFLP